MEHIVNGLVARTGYKIETSWLVALAIGLTTFYLARFWIRIKEYPPGPFPLPVVGNLPALRSKSMLDVVTDLGKRYGGIYTFWMGPIPTVIVTDFEIAKEALLSKKNDMLSRPDTRSFNHFKEHTAVIIFETNNKRWDVTRKVGASAIRKFSDSEILANIVKNATDELSEDMLRRTKPFDPADILQKSVMKIISGTAFGIENLTEAESQRLASLFRMVHENFINSPGDFSPFLRLIFYQRDLNLKKCAMGFGEFLANKFNQNKITFEKGEIRNFSDAVLTSGMEAANEENDSREYLDDSNAQKIIGDLFIAGVDTTNTALTWLILLLGNYPDVQMKIRAEIDENIGARMPVQNDKRNCPYTWATISEALRFRTPAPLSVPHVTDVDTELAGHKIRKGTTVAFIVDAYHKDPKLWDKPDAFKPERFLKEDGSYNNEKVKGYMPFGEGRRMCLGEKLARNDIFLFLVNLLQKLEIKLDIPAGTANLKPLNLPSAHFPHKFNILVNSRQ